MLFFCIYKHFFLFFVFFFFGWCSVFETVVILSSMCIISKYIECIRVINFIMYAILVISFD